MFFRLDEFGLIFIPQIAIFRALIPLPLFQNHINMFQVWETNLLRCFRCSFKNANDPLQINHLFVPSGGYSKFSSDVSYSSFRAIASLHAGSVAEVFGGTLYDECFGFSVQLGAARGHA